MSYKCPACGYAGLHDPPWRDGSSSDDICPSCGIQFGNHDLAGRDPAERAQIHLEWRRRWIAEGSKWHSQKAGPPPEGWDPAAQLRSVTDRILLAIADDRDELYRVAQVRVLALGGDWTSLRERDLQVDVVHTKSGRDRYRLWVRAEALNRGNSG